MNSINIPQLTLVGAGPGDPELLTIAGKKAIEEADVILYDALVNVSILEWSPNAEKIFVGKRKGYKRFEQTEINEMIVEKALSKGHVVRLKGGDSFVFGRGSEEIEYANRFGISTGVIPGISSATSAPVTQGIPLTKRGVAESFYVITGTTQLEDLSGDIEIAAQSSSTIVILMGMSKLPDIVEVFQRLGRGNEAICIVQNAYWESQRSVTATIDTILLEKERLGLSNPAVIIIGEVVLEALKLMNSGSN